jgi:hypothetical protein
MTHVLPPLPFAKDALEPVIPAETIDYRKACPKYLEEINECNF